MNINYTESNPLNLVVKTKKEILYDGAAHSISSINSSGVFDVLPFHSNFITLISNHVIVDRNLETEKKFDLEKGVLYVMANKVTVYVGL